MTKVAELYGLPSTQPADWCAVATSQACPFLDRKCLKNRKSASNLTIGTCSMLVGQGKLPAIICPFRFLERSQIFTDCIHLLKLHEPGNELRIISELTVPGGSVDYCLVSVRDGKPKDFVGIELQALDTTGTVWPERQRFLQTHGAKVKTADVRSTKSYGINWKMTAKTTLMQLHHKITTFEHLSKHFALVMQDCLLDYMRRSFDFRHIVGVRTGDPMQFHAYELQQGKQGFHLALKERISTDADGVSLCLGLQGSAKVDLLGILEQIESKLPQSTLLTVTGAAGAVPISAAVAEEAVEVDDPN
jgi:hypothetical protein